jgi:hypothetical protein
MQGIAGEIMSRIDWQMKQRAGAIRTILKALDHAAEDGKITEGQALYALEWLDKAANK